MAATTRFRIASGLVTFAKWLVHAGLVSRDPREGVTLPRVARKLPDNVLTVREMTRLLSAPRLDDPVELRNRALMELLYATGLRQTEALDLKVEDVDLGEGEVLVRRGKGGKGRIVPLCRESRGVLAAYLAEVRPKLVAARDSGYFFVSKRGRRVDASHAMKMFKRYAASSGIKRPVGFHTFRHSVATHLMQRGGPGSATSRSFSGTRP